MNDDLTLKLSAASEAYDCGWNCAQAILGAYSRELGIAEEVLYRIADGFGNGTGGRDGVCGALTAASIIVSFSCSSGSTDDAEHRQTYEQIAFLTKKFRREFGGLTCREILPETEAASCCKMKVKDAVLLTEQILDAWDGRKSLKKSG